MLRRYTRILAVLLLGYVAVSASLGWWLRQQLRQADLPGWVQTQLQAGLFSSRVDLRTTAAAPVRGQFSGQLQHGPILRAPWQAGLLRFNGQLKLAGWPSSFPDHDDIDAVTDRHVPALRDLDVTVASGLSGHTSITAELPQWLDLRQQPALLNGPVGGTVTMHLAGSTQRGVLQHTHGIVCLPDLNVSWKSLDWRLRLDDTAHWLRSGRMTLRGAMLAINQDQHACTLVDSSWRAAAAVTIGPVQLQLDWPEQSALSLRLDVASWHAAGDNIGPLQADLVLQNVDRSALAAWLQAIGDHQRRPGSAVSQRMLQLGLAAQSAELLRQRPSLQLRKMLISTTSGDFELTGEIQLRPGGLRADLHGETTAAAARQALTVLLRDQSAADRMLQAWRRQGLVRDVDGRWLINIVVNR